MYILLKYHDLHAGTVAAHEESIAYEAGFEGLRS